MRAGKIVAIVFGVLLVIIGLALLAPGGLLLRANSATDSDGYFTTSPRTLQSDGYAIASPDLRLDFGSAKVPGGATMQVSVTSSGAAPVFLGLGPANDVRGYLNGVAYDEITNLPWFSSDSLDYVPTTGGAPASPPGQQSFWVAKQEGTGSQTLQWEVTSGEWTAVIMNADGSAPVAVDISFGAKLGIVLPLGIGFLVGGLVLLGVGGLFLIVIGARKPRRPLQPQPAYPGMPPGAPPAGGGQYPQAQQYQQGPYSPPPYQAVPPQPAYQPAPPPAPSVPPAPPAPAEAPQAPPDAGQPQT